MPAAERDAWKADFQRELGVLFDENKVRVLLLERRYKTFVKVHIIHTTHSPDNTLLCADIRALGGGEGRQRRNRTRQEGRAHGQGGPRLCWRDPLWCLKHV